MVFSPFAPLCSRITKHGKCALSFTESAHCLFLSYSEMSEMHMLRISYCAKVRYPFLTVAYFSFV